MTAFGRKYLVANGGSVDPGAVWLNSGVVAQMFIKIFLCNLILSILHSTDPLCAYAGQYQMDATADDVVKDRRVCAEVEMMLRLKQSRSLCVWSVLSVFALVNLVYASSLTSFPRTYGLEVAGIVLIAVMVSLVVGAALYLARGCIAGWMQSCCSRIVQHYQQLNMLPRLRGPIRSNRLVSVHPHADTPSR